MIATCCIFCIRCYQYTFSLLLPPTCRFTPSCSAYAILALQRYGVFRGGALMLKRLKRCHPWGGHGHDPVP